MAWAVVERRTTATTRRVPPQRGQVRTSVWKVRLTGTTGVKRGEPARLFRPPGPVSRGEGRLM